MINPDKTKFCVSRHRPCTLQLRRTSVPSLVFLVKDLAPVDVVKDLGVLIDKHLSFSDLTTDIHDFNRLNTKGLQNSFDLKQIVTFPTRGDRTLDLVLTNLKEYYKDPIQRPPHGLSDHMSVEVQPKDRPQLSDSRLTIKTRDYLSVNNPTWSG